MINRPDSKKLILHAAAFFIPAALILFAFAAVGVFPFGERSLLVVDMNSEYIDYFMHMNRTFREGGSLLRSWQMGMGLNMLGLIAFYTASPLNIIILLAPQAAVTEAVLIVTVLKFGLCGLFFLVYAGKTFGRWDITALIFSVAYALMGYNVAFSSNIMWLDGVYMLPLVLLGAEGLIKTGSLKLLLPCLAVTFFSSYYIGYMVGIFTFLYFTARFFTRESSAAIYFKKLLALIGGALLAALLCMFLLLPAFLNLYSGQDGGLFTMPQSAFCFNYPMATLTLKLMPGIYDTLIDGALPNVYSTVAAALCGALFFLNKKISLREKLIWGGLMGFIFVSMSFGALNLAWHAFEVPTWFPARYSFVFSFLLIYLALGALREPEGLSVPRIASGGAILFLLFFDNYLYRFSFVTAESAAAALILTAGYTLMLAGARLGKRARTPLICLALLIVCAEAGYSAQKQLLGIHREFIYRERESYYSYRDIYAPAVEAVRALDSGPYRMEVADMRNANGGMALGYSGISHYSTTTDQAANRLMRELGYNTGTINELRFAGVTPLTNGLSGIKYVLSRENMGEGYRLIEEVNGVGIWENTMAFPLVYLAGEEILELDASAQPDPFLLQNGWVSAALPEWDYGAPFRPLEVLAEELENLRVTQDTSPVIYKREIAGLSCAVSFTLNNEKGLAAYAFFPVHNRRFADADVYAGTKFLASELAYRHNTVISLGTQRSPVVSLRIDSDETYLKARYFYGLDIAAGETAARMAGERALNVSRFEDTAIDGVIEADAAGVLMTAIPYDKGWTVRVDGEKVETKRALGVYLAARLPAGTHRVTMRYSPPGFVIGLSISALTATALAARQLLIRLKKKPKK
ncbi:MAG: YfhO family protein [Oscillospiraceae bacterium]|nr:YfhO family protein [Oscillospiraceae bacterium]